MADKTVTGAKKRPGELSLGDDLSLAGQVAIVSAASRGIGRAIAQRLSSQGALVTICARNDQQLKLAAQEIERLSGNAVQWRVLDLGKSSDSSLLVDEVIDHHGKLDILVANSPPPPFIPLSRVQPEDLNDAMNAVFWGPARLILRAKDRMIAQRSGTIIGILSANAVQITPGLTLSTVPRSALLALIRHAAVELGEFGLRANCVLVGAADTNRHEDVLNGMMQREGIEREEALTRMLSGIPLRRIAQPNEVANLVTILASDALGFVNGATIRIDGGMVKSLV